MSARPHRCAGCGVVGRLPLAEPDPDDPRPVLRITFGPDGKPKLVCTLCRPGDASNGV